MQSAISPSQSQIISSTFEQNCLYVDRFSSSYSLLGALALSGSYMTDWLEIAASILLWMAISNTVLYLGAALVALLMMRRHPYVILFIHPLAAMCVIGPVTVGLTTSLVLAYALSASDKEISPWHCMVLGIFQSIMLVFVSFSRLLGTL
ncbi:unnamed protein product [Angiostrongylus costaricensis]|uniref:G_PROTEIN_RECEP_F1_2 domain-containing protein n=1 Tax=Angiostrongylus costaricensis TaxID=334426 RepID=A0A0R3PJS5_ANGCS|nr:unnamed protein product [Angiostrongylus costaricensis]